MSNKTDTRQIREKAREEFQNKINALRDENGALEEQNRGLLERIDKQKKKISELESQLESYDSLIKQLQSYLKLSDDQMEALKNKLSDSGEIEKIMAKYGGLLKGMSRMVPNGFMGDYLKEHMS